MSGMKIEAVFGGFLALIVLAVAIFAIVKTQFGTPGGTSGGSVVAADAGPGETQVPTVPASLPKDQAICQCFNDARKLAESVDVLSADYRTGFEQCRQVVELAGGEAREGGEAWTAGWNAYRSAKPYEASCKAFLRNRKAA
ncbi:MAG: hypothetical protein ACE5FO_06000 [Parvularculaceae bacterium]